MGLILVILLVVLLVVALPLWGYSRNWGHRGSGLCALLLGVLDVLLLTRYVPLG